MNLSTLQTFLEQTPIPEIKAKPKTFLGIAKQPHYENVMSNIYAFFFDVEEEHGMRDLFVSSLVQLINEATPQEKLFYISGFDVQTEAPTNAGGRIDILLSNNEEAIIIENKVYHVLNNNLKDYMCSVIAPDRRGVVLSLFPVNTMQLNGTGFVNILHSDFMERVMKNSGTYLPEAIDKYIVFLKDLYQNISNMSSTALNQEEMEFFIKNQSKINELYAFRNDFFNKLFAQVEAVIGESEFSDFKLYPTRSGSRDYHRLRYFCSPKTNDLSITVVIEDNKEAHNQLDLYLFVEISGKMLENRARFKELTFDDKYNAILHKESFYNSEHTWAHFAGNRYDLDASNASNLTSFIQEKIKDDGFLAVFKKLENTLLVK